jgi:hypothetical protein
MRRWSGIAGIVFIGLVVASRLVGGSLPDPEKRNALAKFVNYYADSAHNDRAVAAVVLGFLGLFAFAWFLGGLWSELRRAEGAASIPTIVVVAGGAAFVALGITEHVLSGVVGVTLSFSKGYTLHHGFDAATALLLNEAGRGAFLGAMVAVGAATTAAAVIILRTGVFSRWVAWLGIALAVLCLPAIPFLTFIAAILLALWTAAISATLIRTEQAQVPAGT